MGCGVASTFGVDVGCGVASTLGVAVGCGVALFFGVAVGTGVGGIGVGSDTHTRCLVTSLVAVVPSGQTRLSAKDFVAASKSDKKTIVFSLLTM